jgi:hypothetical protein
LKITFSFFQKDLKGKESASSSSGASFKEKPKDQVGVDGDRITVTCKVTGTPKPEVTWFKSKKTITKSKDFALEFNGEIAKLTINDAHVEDAGDYTCEVWNEKGQQTAPFKLTIKEKKGKPKRTRPVEKEAPKPDEDEIRKEKRKSDAAAAAPEITVDEPAAASYEEEGPKRARKPQSNLQPATTNGRKVSASKLNIIDEAGGKYSLLNSKSFSIFIFISLSFKFSSFIFLLSLFFCSF